MINLPETSQPTDYLEPIDSGMISEHTPSTPMIFIIQRTFYEYPGYKEQPEVV